MVYFVRYWYFRRIFIDPFDQDPGPQVEYVDPEYVQRLTPLHLVCLKYPKDLGLLQTYFRLNDEANETLEIDARDARGNTPLHYALEYGRNRNITEKTVELLLRRGADPNLANDDGRTPLHFISRRYDFGDRFVDEFFAICGELQRTLLIDARDKWGDTPLHLALKSRLYCTGHIIELLLRRGTDPNLAGAKGFTALHILCQRQRQCWIERLQELFRISDDMGQRLLMDARDEFGRTALQWAVATFNPDVVDLLLARGAQLAADFRFPDATCLADRYRQDNDFGWGYKLELAAGALAIVERLEEAGYAIDRAAAMNIMKLFELYGIYEDTDARNGFWDHSEHCVELTKSTMIKSTLSLYDLFELRAEEAARLLTYRDYLSIASSHINLIDGMHRHFHLCETVSRGFFRSWALDPFLELTRDRLPILCCEMIIDEFKNEDLYRICLANEAQSS
ncbi:unnamed protein product [Trichogramma brassicae]|uniref:Uncharacterized protein n=1 Tax=Trichogramma brassicae TaxID=86971 RepID=A0A6H5I6S0_9HYME|nr:unnamed protein product [Trichogramma brassicae]